MKFATLVAFGMLCASAYADNGVFSLEAVTQPQGNHDGYLVSFESSFPDASRAALHKKAGAQVDTRMQLLPDMVLVRGANEARLLAAYKGVPGVRYIEPNARARRELPQIEAFDEPRSPVVSGTENPSDSYFNNQWSLFNESVLKIRGAWAKTTGARSVIVGVVDTGLQFNHPDIQGNEWKNTGEIAGNGIDDDGNGYVDDVYGWDMINKKPLTGDGHYHGTHVAGTIGARTNNGIGVAGMNWDVTLLPVMAVPGDGDETDADVIASFLYAAKGGARVINCSFGKSSAAQSVKDAIESLKDRVLFVVAAGNDGRSIDQRPTYPASFGNANMLVVAATTSGGGLAWFSNYGPKSVHLAAPGNGIWSTIAGGKYSSLSGTSMATPHVAGGAALVLSKFPHLTPVQLRQVLLESGDEDSAFVGKVSSGRKLNVEAALAYAESHFPQP